MFAQRLLLVSFSFLLGSVTSYGAVDNTKLSVWANEAIVATYTYNYKNFLERQKEIATYFTADGWIAYSKALQQSKLPEMVKKNNYFVSSVAVKPPEIKLLQTGHWQAVMPILVMYQNPQYEQKQTLEVTLGFTSAASGQGVRGLAITSLQSKVIEPPCQCKSQSSSDDKQNDSSTSPK